MLIWPLHFCGSLENETAVGLIYSMLCDDIPVL